MRIVVTGATGNVGTSLLRALATEDRVDSALGIARRRPAAQFPKTTFVQADIVHADLAPHLRGADVVVHLAWLIQPSHDEPTMRRTNVDGTRRVLRAVAEAGVPALVVASSVGAYSPGPKDRRVDESWPTEGIRSSYYAQHKAQQERLLDAFEAEHPTVRVVRVRPGLVFKREAASEVRRFFIGPFVPGALLRPSLLPVLPLPPGLAVQAEHSYDVGDAFLRAALHDGFHGAVNLAAEPVLDAATLGEALRARPVPVPAAALRAAVDAAWRARLIPVSPGWLDMGLGVPLMDTRRAREELGWAPAHSSIEALVDLLDGFQEGAGLPLPPLRPDSALTRVRELLTGVGGAPR